MSVKLHISPTLDTMVDYVEKVLIRLILFLAFIKGKCVLHSEIRHKIMLMGRTELFVCRYLTLQYMSL